MTKISLAIPTWESGGRGAEFIDDLFRTIEIQQFKDYNVWVSDHSVDNSVKNVCRAYQNRINVEYIRNPENRGNGPANTNNAIDLCDGEIVKVMFQDDFFYDDEALGKIYDALSTSDKTWLVCGSNHTRDDGHSFYWDLMPKWSDQIINGVNTISSPSVVAFKNGIEERFETNVRMMMDCEFYYTMDKAHGQPVYLHDVLVSNRVHDGQISQQITADPKYFEAMKKEIDYCFKKHGVNYNEV